MQCVQVKGSNGNVEVGIHPGDTISDLLGRVCVVYGVWCMVYGVWCMVYGVCIVCMV